jgi:hypothetical protein
VPILLRPAPSVSCSRIIDLHITTVDKIADGLLNHSLIGFCLLFPPNKKINRGCFLLMAEATGWVVFNKIL